LIFAKPGIVTSSAFAGVTPSDNEMDRKAISTLLIYIPFNFLVLASRFRALAASNIFSSGEGGRGKKLDVLELDDLGWPSGFGFLGPNC